jgi:hypothetical protein
MSLSLGKMSKLNFNKIKYSWYNNDKKLIIRLTNYNILFTLFNLISNIDIKTLAIKDRIKTLAFFIIVNRE